MRLFMSPVMMSITAFLLSLLLGLVIALILSAFLKRQPAAVAEVTPPVT
jgi:hypothetical protein